MRQTLPATLVRRPAAAIALALALVACQAGPPTDPSPPLAATAFDEEGPFLLELELADHSYAAGEPIEGVARLHVAIEREVAGSGGGLIGFSLHDVDRGRSIEGVQRSDCVNRRLVPNDPVVTGLAKGGGYDPTDPEQDWIEAFLGDPVYRLPAGTWEIEAWALLAEADCAATLPRLSARIRIVVTD